MSSVLPFRPRPHPRPFGPRVDWGLFRLVEWLAEAATDPARARASLTPEIGTAALAQWHTEIRNGTRTAAQWDDLHYAACRGAANAEYERTVGAPQRARVAELTTCDDEALADAEATVTALAHAVAIGSDPALCASLLRNLADDLRSAQPTRTDATVRPIRRRRPRAAMWARDLAIAEAEP